jgi:hypothetical protein
MLGIYYWMVRTYDDIPLHDIQVQFDIYVNIVKYVFEALL